MPAPHWAVGMQKLGPGVYVDERARALHISEREICEHFGVPDTPENCAIAERAAREIIRQHWGELATTVIEREDEAKR